MRKLRNNLIGIDQGSKVLFSDFETDGVMWTGSGERSIAVNIRFSEAFLDPPTVMVGLAMWDLGQGTNARGDLSTRRITPTDFEIVFKTWEDTRVARIRADWIAIGETRHRDDWDLG